MFDEFGINAGYVEELHTRWLQSPHSVEADWQRFFEGSGGAPGAPAPAPQIPALGPIMNGKTVNGNGNGVGVANGNGNGSARAAAAAAALAVENGSPPASFAHRAARPGEIVPHRGETYCSSIGVESTHIEGREPRLWLQQQMESTRNRALLDRTELVRILTKLTEAEIFEQFIHKNYVGAKRFSLEGSESMIPMIDLLVEAAGQHGIEELVIGMAHRGRLNVLVNVMGKNVREI